MPSRRCTVPSPAKTNASSYCTRFDSNTPTMRKAAIGDVVVRVLAHDDDALAQIGLEPLEQFAAHEQPLVVPGLEEAALGQVVGDERDPPLSLGVDADQRDPARLPLAGDDGGHPHPGGPGDDLRPLQHPDQLVAGRRHHVRSHWDRRETPGGGSGRVRAARGSRRGPCRRPCRASAPS